MLKIYCGRESADREKFIMSRIDPRGRALLIVPDQYTLEAERRLFEETGAEALMDVEVTSMSRLGSRLLQELGGSKRTFIDKYGRHMILSHVLREHRDELQIFGGLEEKNSFLEMINNFISEMKQYNSGLAELEAVKEQVKEGTYVHRKLSDLSLIYGEYEKRIRGKYTDSEDYIDLFLSRIGESELIKGNRIWIYGFDSFAPKALSVIGELMTYAEEVSVVLTADRNRNSRDAELFDLAEMVIRNLRNTAEARGIECMEADIPAGFETYPDHHKYAAVRHIEREIYALPSEPFKGWGDEDLPVFVEASNLYNEAENAAAYVLHLIRDKGYRLGDIRLILNDQEVRGAIVRRVFGEYGLEIFMDQGREAEDNPIIRYVMSLLDAAVGNYSTPDIMAMLKTGFAGLGPEEVSDLENYAIKYRIKGTMWLKPFTKGTFEYEEEDLIRLNTLRETAVQHVKTLREALKQDTYEGFIEEFYGILRDEVDLPSRIGALVDAQLDQDRSDLAEETDQVWDSFIKIMEQIREIMGSERFRPKDLRDLLQTGLSGIRVGMLPPSKDGLLMGTMQRTRMGRTRALIVIGANEGILPSGKPAPGIFGDEEKELFSSRGVEFSKTDSVVLMEEKMGIYRNLSGAGEKLYISYSMSDLDGKSQKASSVWTKLRELFPDAVVRRDAVSDRNLGMLLNGESSGLRHLANALERYTEGEKLPEYAVEGLDWYKTHAADKLEPLARGLTFTNESEELGRDLASRLYKRDPSGELGVSPSRIERFSRCPFSHFITYGLRPEERRVYEIAPREIGDVYHNCLMKMTDKLTVKGLALTDPESPWMKITDGQLRDMVEGFVKEETGKYRDGLFRRGAEESYHAERMKESAVRVCRTLVDQVRSGDILRGRFEVAFGRGREIPPVEIDLGEDLGHEKAYIEGKIDRVDYLPDSRVKIIDYKTGGEDFVIKEAKEGFRLQLMLYLEAALEKSGKPAGVFYFNIKDPSIKVEGKNMDEASDLPDEDYLKSEITKAFKMNGIMVDDPEVIRNIAGDFDGYSDVVALRKSSKDGSVSSTSKSENKLLSEDEFRELRETVAGKVAEKTADLLKGKTDIFPMKTSKTSACDKCRLKGICRFNTIFEGNKWNPVE